MLLDNSFLIQELKYTAKDYKRIVSVDDYIAGFYDLEKFRSLCAECPNYGKTWACPPFSVDTEAILRRYKYALLIATKIIPAGSNLPLADSLKYIHPERVRLQNSLLEMERVYGGMALGFAGKCIYCPETEKCSRLIGQPCRHPDLARPSLESFGFDIGKTTSEFFNIPLMWGKDGKMPKYLTLVCGFFTNAAL